MVKRHQRRSVPNSHLAVDLQVDVQQADERKLSQVEALELLVALRSGDSTAMARLLDGFQWLVYEFAVTRNGRFREDYVGELYLGLSTAFERLQNNDCEDVEQFIRDELKRTLHDYRRSESGNIYPPASTLSNQRRNGQAVYHCLRQLDNTMIDETGDEVERIDLGDPSLSGPTETQDGKCYSQRRQLTDVQLSDIDRRIDLTSTEIERKVLELIEEGCSVSETARLLEMERHQVRPIIAKIRKRAEHYEYEFLLDEERKSA